MKGRGNGVTLECEASLCCRQLIIEEFKAEKGYRVFIIILLQHKRIRRFKIASRTEEEILLVKICYHENILKRYIIIYSEKIYIVKIYYVSEKLV